MSTENNQPQQGKNANQSDNRASSNTNGEQGSTQNASAADWDETVREAEADRNERKPGQSQGGNSEQHNNGRGGGK